MSAGIRVALLVSAMAPLVAGGPLLAGDRGPCGSAVVAVEVATDPFSLGPALVEEIAGRRASRRNETAFQRELARRLGGVSRGSGFFVNSGGDAVTSAHVVMGGTRDPRLKLTRQEWESLNLVVQQARDIWLRVGSRYYLADLVSLSEESDLAVVRIRLPPGDTARFPFLCLARSGRPQVGDEIVVLGFPTDDTPPGSEGCRASHGHVLSLITGSDILSEVRYTPGHDPVTGKETVLVSGREPGPVGRFQHTAPTVHGYSGGPVLDTQGAVVGVAYAQLVEVSGQRKIDAGLSLALTAGVLRRFLSEKGIRFTEGPGPLGPASAVPAPPPAPRLPTAGGLSAGQPTNAPRWRSEAERLGKLRQEGRFAEAFLEAASLAWLGPKGEATVRNAAAYFRERRARDRACADPEGAGSRTLMAVAAAWDAQRWVMDTLLNGAAAQQAGRVAAEVEQLIARVPAGDDEPAALCDLALSHLYLTLDDILVFQPDSATARQEALRAAVRHAQAATMAEPDAPGAHRTLAWALARLADLQESPEVSQAALAAARRAYELDPGDTLLPEALWALALRAGEWEEASYWEEVVRGL